MAMRLIFALIAPLILFSGCIESTDFYGRSLNPNGPIEFELYDQNDNQFNISDIDTNLIMVGFIHTSCGEKCDNLTSSMAESYDLLSNQERKTITLLSITTDPWHDDTNRLHYYMENNSVDWPHLTVMDINAELAMMESVWAAFGTVVEISEKQSQSMARCSIHLMDYTVNHTIHAILVDAERNTRVQWLYSEWDSERVVADIRRLASE